MGTNFAGNKPASSEGCDRTLHLYYASLETARQDAAILGIEAEPFDGWEEDGKKITAIIEGPEDDILEKAIDSETADWLLHEDDRETTWR